MRKICVFTGSRAEYGLLRPLITEIHKDKELKLQLVVSGMHLSSGFGMTYKEIEKDGFRIDKKVRMPLNSDEPIAICNSMAHSLKGVSKALEELKPDLVVILGDRFESFTAAIAAMVLRIPIAHIHGGEATYGLIDEAIRHSITKMSHLHFTSTEQYRKRVIQLGEDPRRVFNVGALGLDNIANMRLLPKKILEKELIFKFKKHNLLITFHPVTLEKESPQKQCKELLGALDGLDETALIFTKSNADMGGGRINQMIDNYVSKNSGRAVAFASLGQIRYLSAMRWVDGVIGNSSSGIIEAPSFKVGTINIGDRQKGRLKPDSIIDCKSERADILLAIKRLYSKQFQGRLKKVVNPYGDGNAAKRIKTVLKKWPLDNILKKDFYNIN